MIRQTIIIIIITLYHFIFVTYDHTSFGCPSHANNIIHQHECTMGKYFYRTMCRRFFPDARTAVNSRDRNLLRRICL